MHITNQIIKIDEFINDPLGYEGGAVVIFCGKVRSINKNKKVKYIFYEAYETMAEKMIKDVLETVKHKWGLLYANAVHRIGHVNINECSVLVITVSAHRNFAYESNQFIIEQIKYEVPIWKCEYYDENTFEWLQN